jgi:hypothetical protein
MLFRHEAAPDLRHLLAHASNVVIPNLVQLLLILPFDWLTLTENLCTIQEEAASQQA